MGLVNPRPPSPELRTYARYRGGVAPKSRGSVRTVRFFLEVPYLGDLTGAWTHLDSCLLNTALARALDLEVAILLKYGFAMLRVCRAVVPLSCAHVKI